MQVPCRWSGMLTPLRKDCLHRLLKRLVIQMKNYGEARSEEGWLQFTEQPPKRLPHYLLIKVTLIDQLLHKERHWLWQILVFLKVDVKNKIFFFIFVVWFQAECSMWRLIITDKIFLCKNLDLVETGSWGFKWTSKNKQHRETQMTAMDKPSWVTIMLIKESFTLMKESWVTHFSVLEVFET